MTMGVAAVLRFVVFALLWLALTGAGTHYLAYGAVSVIAATVLSLWSVPPQAPDPASWPRRAWAGVSLALWFAWSSALGGADVARRVIVPRPSIDPKVVVAPVVLPTGPARHLALLMMNVMPGTMVQRVVRRSHEDEVELHTLSITLHPAQQWADVQRRVAAAFGIGA